MPWRRSPRPSPGYRRLCDQPVPACPSQPARRPRQPDRPWTRLAAEPTVTIAARPRCRSPSTINFRPTRARRRSSRTPRHWRRPTRRPRRQPAAETAAEDIESVAARRIRRPRATRQVALADARTGAPRSCLLIAINIGLVAWRADIVRLLPQTASLYAAIGLPVNLRGLVFHRARHPQGDAGRRPDAGGRRRHQEQRAGARPTCRGCALPCATPSGHEIYTWTALPARNAIAPGRHHAVPLAARLAAAGGARGAGAFLQPARPGRRNAMRSAMARILIAEDEEGIRSLVARALAQDGHAVVDRQRRRRGARPARARARRIRPAADRHPHADHGWHCARAGRRARPSACRDPADDRLCRPARARLRSRRADPRRDHQAVLARRPSAAR